MFKLFLLIALVPALVSATLNVNLCPESDFPALVEINGCEVSPCTMVRGVTKSTTIKFVVPRDTETFESKVRAKVGFFTINYELPEELKLGCNFISEGGNTTSCPLKAGDVVVYNLAMEVEPESPTFFQPILTFNILDDQGKNIVCYSWTAIIV